jgi:glycerate kinase
MKIIIAPDSFKGSLSALEAAQCIKEGLSTVWPEAEYVLFPIADGGEGTVDTLIALTGGTIYSEPALDPLGREIVASYGILGDNETAVVEMASASGLTRLTLEERDPARANSFGFGQQLRQALARGVKKLIIGLGGSGTNDAGSGMLVALGLRLLDAQGQEVAPGGTTLKQIASIDASNLLSSLSEVPIVVAVDVQNPLIGPDGASAIFGPQKGVTKEMIPVFDASIEHFATLAEKLTGRSVLYSPGAGAAGGLGGAFKLFTNCTFRPGVEVVLSEGKFTEKVQGATLIVTGEGLSDLQTIWGKAPVGVAALGSQYSVPTVCLSASLGEGYEKMYTKGISAIMSMTPGPLELAECMRNAGPILVDAAQRMARLLRVTIGS